MMIIIFFPVLLAGGMAGLTPVAARRLLKGCSVPSSGASRLLRSSTMFSLNRISDRTRSYWVKRRKKDRDRVDRTMTYSQRGWFERHTVIRATWFKWRYVLTTHTNQLATHALVRIQLETRLFWLPAPTRVRSICRLASPIDAKVSTQIDHILFTRQFYPPPIQNRRLNNL